MKTQNCSTIPRAISNRLSTAFLTLVLVLASNAPLLAFPNWIGVYGAIQRHSGGNSGTFTILANDDYWGLHASVGIQVNGGAWTEYRMAYSGRQDTNAVWTFSTDQPLPAGAQIKYYFHLWDNTGLNAWDNNAGANYSFIAGAPSPVFIYSDMRVNGAIRFQPRGDIPMGEFTRGPLP